MKSLKISMLTVCVFLSFQLKAWDEVTHAYMTKMIPDLVTDPTLKHLLRNNPDEFVYGCWYTDTYQYTDNRINTLNPHIISKYGAAFLNYLQKEEVKQQDNYEKLVALYLGSLSHIIEDFWYDSNLNKYQKTKKDKYTGDSKHGAFVIKQHNYLTLKVKRYFPEEDLFKMYSDAGMLEQEYDTIGKFVEIIDSWSNQQYLMLRSLKLINFLAGNQMYNESLWTAGNLNEINGGMENCAEVAAKFIEASWNELNQNSIPKILHADYFEFENKIAVLTSGTTILSEISADMVYIVNSANDTIHGKLKQVDHPDNKKGIAEYAFSFLPSENLQKGTSCKFQVNLKDNTNPFIYSFQAGNYIEKMAEPKPFLTTMGLGIFGFIPLVAIAGLLFGIAGIIRFNWNYQHENRKLPVSLQTISKMLYLASIMVLLFSIYVLVNRGEVIIDIAL